MVLVIVAAGVVCIARMVVLDASVVNRRINIGLLIGCVGVALREPDFTSAVAHRVPALTTDVLHLISEQVIIFFSATLFLIGCNWLIDRERRWLAPLTYGLAAAAAVFEVVVGLVARAERPALPSQPGWEVVAQTASPLITVSALIAHNGFCYWLALTLLLLAFREFRRRPRGRELAICAGIAVFATVLFVQITAITAAALLLMNGRTSPFTDALTHGDRWSVAGYVAALVALAAVPLRHALPDRLSWDEAARLQRRLFPLWQELTAVCPEVVQPPASEVALQRSRYRLHRTVVEIRDCMLILSRPPADGADGTASASRLGDAIRVAQHTATAAHSTRRCPTPSCGLLHDAHQLRLLAEHWAHAKRVVEHTRP